MSRLLQTSLPIFNLLLIAPVLHAAETVTRPFVGVTVRQVHLDQPRPLRICVAEIDLTAQGVSFLVSPGNGDPNGDEPGDPNGETTRQSTFDFLKEHQAQLAINATFFGMQNLETDNVGLLVSAGDRVSPFHRRWPALNIDPENLVTIVRGEHDTYQIISPGLGVTLHNAIGGSDQIITDGQPTTDQRDFSTALHPRSAIGFTANRKLILVTVDGRQQGLSEGMSLLGLANFMIDLKCEQALNLDGGGSTTMVIADPEPRVVNTPSGKNAADEYGMLRQNGASLAVFARPDPNNHPHNSGVGAQQ